MKRITFTFLAASLLFTACAGGLQEAYDGSQENPKRMITTVAGNGTGAFDISPTPNEIATETPFSFPRGLALAPNGDLYVALLTRHCVVKVDAATQKVTVAAGICGSSGSSGDGSLATAAKLNYPKGLAFYGGNLYIADSANQKIRKVNASGDITTEVSIGETLEDVAVDGSGNLFVSSYSAGAIWKVDAGTKNLIISGLYSDGIYVALDAAGNLYVSDKGHHCIKKYTSAGVLLSTVAGICETSGFSGDGGPATQAKLNQPSGLRLDARGNLYFIDSLNQRIRRVDGATGVISTIAGTGAAGYNGDGIPASEATVHFIAASMGLIFDAQGNLYFSDEYNHRVRKIFWQ